MKKLYIASFIFFVAFTAVALFVPQSEECDIISALLGIMALLPAFYQIALDKATIDNQQRLQAEQHLFQLASASHMSQVVFDKHVSFCEEYMDEVYETVETLRRQNNSNDLLNNIKSLESIRRKYATWTTNDILAPLAKFENILSLISSNWTIMELRAGDIDASDRMFKLIEKLLGHQKGGSDQSKGITIEELKDEIRVILGIPSYVEMRKDILKTPPCDSGDAN